MKIKKFGYRFLLFEMSFENQNQYFLDLRFSRDLLTNLAGPELLPDLNAHFSQGSFIIELEETQALAHSTE